jgi:hypothetical protein
MCSHNEDTGVLALQWTTGGVEGWTSARLDGQLEALRGAFSELGGEVSGAGRGDIAVLVDPAGQDALAVRALLKPRTYTLFPNITDQLKPSQICCGCCP